MAWVETRITRTSQPQDACGIDWSNPLTKGLLLCVLPANNVDLVSGKTGIFAGAPSFASGRTGRALKTSGSGQLAYIVNTTPPALKDWTLFSVANTIASDVSRWLLSGAESTDGSGCLIGVITGNSTASRVRLWARDNLTQSGTSEDTELTAFNGSDTRVLVRKTHATAKLECFVNGAKSATSPTIGDTASTYTVARWAWGGGMRGSVLNSFAGDVYLSVAWDRNLTNAEAKAISENPWQLYEPEVQRIWVDDYVFAGGAATAIPIGVQATGSVGTPSATGAARATPAGVSASSAVGTPIAVGGAIIPATVLPAGVQATAAVGAVSARGAAVAQPAGVTASGAVGTPSAVAGTSIPATVLPAGVQASSAVGTPTVTAAAIAQPLGVAVIGYVGTPTIATGVSGVAVAYPAGVQAIGQVGTLIATGAAWTAVVGVQAVASVGAPFAYEGALISTTAGAQTRPSRLQSSSRPSRIQTGSRASR